MRTTSAFRTTSLTMRGWPTYERLQPNSGRTFHELTYWRTTLVASWANTSRRLTETNAPFRQVTLHRCRSVNSGELSECGLALWQDSPGVTCLRGPGLTFHRPGRNSHASRSVYGLRATPGDHCLTRRGEVPCGVHVPATIPHSVQTYVRSDRASLAFTTPQPEQVLLDGNHRSTTIVRPPVHAVLNYSRLRSSPNEASQMRQAKQWFLSIPATNKSSMTTVPHSRARAVASL